MNKNNYRNGVLALLFMLIALPAAMMAQTNTERYMVVTENDGTVTVFNFDEVESVTWDVPVPEPEPLPGSFGTGKANIGGHKVDVEWIQLWADGPRFAKYNVGVTDGKAESYGGHYAWGGNQDKVDDHKNDTEVLKGTDDTATNLWGSNWRMPTKAEFEALLANCDVEWTTVNGVNGCKFTGKGDYVNNNLFFAAAGLYYHGRFFDQGDQFQYWSSESYEESLYAYALVFCLDDQPDDEHILACPLLSGISVRAIYDPQPEPTTGTAKATIGGEEVDVPWVQLWEDGPKFAEYNVGVTDGKAESFGGYYCWGSSIDKDPRGTYKEGTDALTGTDDTATNLWGSAWRMPTKAELDDLLANCDVAWTDNYKNSGVKGVILTGKGEYKGNSVFLPAAGYCYAGDVDDQGSYGNYWSSMPKGDYFAYSLNFNSGNQIVDFNNRLYGYFVRAVLAE